LIDQKSIAVLPFRNLSTDPENDFFADGVTEELLIALGQITGLKVTARTSSFAYKGHQKDVRIIGNELGVSTVLEGSVRKVGNRIRITAQLIRTDNGFTIWSERFDRELSDIFQLQDEISLLIAEQIRENFGHIDISDHLILTKTNHIDAYQQYLKGRLYQLNWSLEEFERAIACYQLSTQLDPAYSEPHFGLVQCYSIMAGWRVMDREEALRKADEHLRTGLALQPESAPAYFSQATRCFWVEWKAHEALQFLKKALSISPNDTESLEQAAECYMALGQFEEAFTHIDQALKRNPLSANHHYTKGNIYYLQGQYLQAIHWMNRALRIDQHWELAAQVKACCLILQGNGPVLEQFLNQHPGINNQDGLRTLFQLLQREGKKMSTFEPEANPYLPFEVYFPLYQGNAKKAFAALQEGVSNRYGQFINFSNDPLMRPLHQQASFHTLVKTTFPVPQVEADKATPSAPSSKLSKEEIVAYKEALQTVITTDEVYLDADLTLRSLAKRINLHPNKLSWLLNDTLQQNFNEYINGHRLSAFQQKALNPAFSHYSILGLAYECGFNSKSVFNEFFKRSTGLTPSAWLRQHR
jgi:adenylate cyclase